MLGTEPAQGFTLQRKTVGLDSRARLPIGSRDLSCRFGSHRKSSTKLQPSLRQHCNLHYREYPRQPWKNTRLYKPVSGKMCSPCKELTKRWPWLALFVLASGFISPVLTPLNSWPHSARPIRSCCLAGTAQSTGATKLSQSGAQVLLQAQPPTTRSENKDPTGNMVQMQRTSKCHICLQPPSS